MKRSSSLWCLKLAIVAASMLAAATGTRAQAPADREEPRKAAAAAETVLFPFDDHSIPWTYGLSYNLVQGRRRGIVLRPGESGPDSQHIINHGSILRIGDELRMWYLCAGDQEPPIEIDPEEFQGETASLDDNVNPRNAGDERTFNVCYATSRDGLHWERPALGLIEYGGNTRNNLVQSPVEGRIVNLRVIHEPEDANPERRFKMALQSHKYRSRLAF